MPLLLASFLLFLFLFLSPSPSNSLPFNADPDLVPSQCSDPQPLSIIIEAPTNTSNSYALVAANIALALSRRKDVGVSLHKLPNYSERWPSSSNSHLFTEEENHVLNSLPRLDTSPPTQKDAQYDLTIRVQVDFSPAINPSHALLILATTERGHLSQLAIAGDTPVYSHHGRIVAPTKWAKDGFTNEGGRDVAVIPHGIDIHTFAPLPASDRASLRAEAGWTFKFVFLHVSAMTSNKNVDLLLAAFYDLSRRFSNLLLVLKGNDELYDSFASLTKNPLFVEMVEEGTIEYVGREIESEGIAQLHQLSDAYVAPYSYEGFNIPVLEAMACGTPVVVSGGGCTDDFVDSEGLFGYRIETTVKEEEGVQRLRGGMEEIDTRGFYVEDLPGKYVRATTKELVVDQEDLLSKMAKIVIERKGFEATRDARVSWVQNKYSWDVVAERIVEEGVRFASELN